MEDLYRSKDVFSAIRKHKKRAAPKSVKGPVAEGYRLAHDHIEEYLCLCVPTVQSETESKWIPVEERLPENGKDVLVFSRGYVYVWSLITVEDKDGNRETVWEDEYGDWKLIKFVTHWMPLPEPPKQKGNSDG